jgi:hypothetical protein
MEELLARLNSEFDEAEGWIRIVDADWYADDLRLSLSVLMHDESNPEIWEVSCTGVIEESISSVGEEILTLLSDSPLLIPYREIEVDLFFSENLCNPALLLGLIFSSCVEVFKKTEYLERFLNQKPTLSGIVSSKFGTLGRFPKPLADRIVQTLKDEPIRVSPTEVGIPKLWTGTEFVEYPSLSVFELGASFVIGESFSASRA